MEEWISLSEMVANFACRCWSLQPGLYCIYIYILYSPNESGHALWSQLHSVNCLWSRHWYSNITILHKLCGQCLLQLHVELALANVKKQLPAIAYHNLGICFSPSKSRQALCIQKFLHKLLRPYILAKQTPQFPSFILLVSLAFTWECSKYCVG